MPGATQTRCSGHIEGVDIYNTEGSSPRRWVSEPNDSALPFDDGLIFWNIRYHQMRNNKSETEKWIARLSGDSKRRDLAQLQKRNVFSNLRKALDRLLPFRGLWPAFQMGTFHRLLTMKFPEELAHYLDHICSIWKFIVGAESAHHLDSHTVQCFQGRSPFFSTADQQYIQHHFKAGRLFSSMPMSAREQACSRALQVKVIIPSLHSFLQDSIFLEPCFLVLRHLLPPKYKGTIMEGLYDCYTQPEHGKILIQTAENDFVTILEKPQNFAFWPASCQLILLALRNYPYMTHLRPKKTKRILRLWDERSSNDCWLLLAHTAFKLGFSTPAIWRKSSDNPNLVNVKTLLPSGRSTSASMVDVKILEQKVCRIASKFDPSPCVAPAQMTKDVHEDWRLDHRCGRSFDHAYDDNLPHLFLGELYRNEEPLPRENITSLMVLRDIFHAFFGSQGRLSVQSTNASGIAEHVGANAGRPTSEAWLNHEVQATDAMDVEMEVENATSPVGTNGAEISSRSLPSAATEPEESHCEQQPEPAIWQPLQVPASNIENDNGLGVSGNARDISADLPPSLNASQTVQALQPQIADPHFMVTEVNRGRVQETDVVEGLSTSTRSHHGQIILSPNKFDSAETLDQPLADEQQNSDQALPSADFSSIPRSQHQPASLNDRSAQNLDLQRTSAQTIFPGDVLKLSQPEFSIASVEQPLQAGKISADGQELGFILPSSGVDHAPGNSDGSPIRPTSSPPSAVPPLESGSGRNKRKTRSRSPRGRPRQPESPTLTSTGRRHMTIYPGGSRILDRVPSPSNQDGLQIQSSKHLLEAKKRMFEHFSLREVVFQPTPGMEITPTKFRTPYRGAIGVPLLHLDAWHRDFYRSKLMPNCIIESEGEQAYCTFYSRERESQIEMLQHLKHGRSEGAILAIPDLNNGKWKVFDPNKYKVVIAEFRPILIASKGFCSEICFKGFDESCLIFPYWHSEAREWRYWESKREKANEPVRSKRSKRKENKTCDQSNSDEEL